MLRLRFQFPINFDEAGDPAARPGIILSSIYRKICHLSHNPSPPPPFFFISQRTYLFPMRRTLTRVLVIFERQNFNGAPVD